MPPKSKKQKVNASDFPTTSSTVNHGGLPASLDTDRLAELKATATALCTSGKGFLASDESAGPWLRAGHSEAKKIPDTIENRAAYRSMCFKTPGLGDHISGCILHWETLFQEDADGNKMVDLLNKQGIVVGIKLDKGYNKDGMPGTAVGPLGHAETACKGLDDLQERAAKAYAQGARFAKWRNVLQIDPAQGLPSDLSIQEATVNLARYAAICQREGLVPIVEPEIVPNGDHDVYACAAATERVLAAQFMALKQHNVYLEGAVLKPNMVKNGLAGPIASPVEVATLTITALMRTVPAAMPGIFFLSGETPIDQDNEETATINLSNMNAMFKNTPWHVSFSFGKALQKTCIVTWANGFLNKKTSDAARDAAAQKALKARAGACGAANLGTYEAGSCASVGTDGNVKQAAGPY
jgi:fructose-bisphosphate aldolase class I